MQYATEDSLLSVAWQTCQQAAVVCWRQSFVTPAVQSPSTATTVTGSQLTTNAAKLDHRQGMHTDILVSIHRQ